MDKNITLNKELLINGVNKLADTVKVTMGGKGKVVVIESMLAPIVTKDGVTVAKYVDLQCPFEMQGAKLIKQSAEKTVEDVADGTTTSVVLSQALINFGHISEKSVRDIQDNYTKDLETTTKALKKLSKKGKAFDVAKVSSNGDKEIAKLVADAFKLVGPNGVVRSEQSELKQSELHFEEGCKIMSGWEHEIFNKVEMDKTVFIIYNDNLKDLSKISQVFETAVPSGYSVLIAVDKIDDRAMNQLVYNRANNFANFAVIGIPFGKEQWFEDMEAITGAKPSNGATDNLLDNAGYLSKVIVRGADTSFVPTKDISEYVNSLEDKERASVLGAGICTIKVGGVSEAEKVEKLDRVDDAIGAVASSFKLGVIPGGGNALKFLSQTLDLSDEFKEALKYPAKVILDNAEIKVDEEVEYNEGYDVISGEYKKDLIKAGIVDSTEGTIKALESAVSVAKIVLQTNAIILTNNE